MKLKIAYPNERLPDIETFLTFYRHPDNWSFVNKAFHPHPALGESIGMAAQVAKGSGTNVPAVRQ